MCEVEVRACVGGPCASRVVRGWEGAIVFALANCLSHLCNAAAEAPSSITPCAVTVDESQHSVIVGKHILCWDW